MNDVVEYYQRRGFPYFSISDDYLEKEFKKLSIFNTTYLWKKPDILRSISVGNSIFKHFMPHMVEAKYKGISPKETFDNYMMFRKVLEYSLKSKHSVLPDIVYNNLIFFNGGVVGFPCGVAKAIVEKFSPVGGTVVDPCAGWGGRMLGTVASKREYLGFEPWEKTFNGLNQIRSFLRFDAGLLSSEFSQAKAPPSCDLVFTSPPYIDLETYGKSITMEYWKELMREIIEYSENSLKSGGYLILNIPKSLKVLLPPTTLEKRGEVYWLTASRKRSLENAEVFFIWQRP